MTKTEAKKIGRRQGLISVGLGLLVAQLIMTRISSQEGILKGFFWFTDFNYLPNILVGVLSIILSGLYFGQLAGILILLRKWNHMLTGFVTGLVVIVSATFVASWIGFFQEGIKYIGMNHDPFSDYIITPIVTVTIFGLIPVLIIGIWFGISIKNKGNTTSYPEHRVELK